MLCVHYKSFHKHYIRTLNELQHFTFSFFYEHMNSLFSFPWELKGKVVKVFCFCFLANLSIHLELMCNNKVELASWCESHHATQNFEVQAFQMGFKGLKTFCTLNQKLMVLVGNDWKDEKVFYDCCVDDLTLEEAFLLSL